MKYMELLTNIQTNFKNEFDINLSRNDISSYMKLMLYTITELENDSVRIPHIGTFHVKTVEAGDSINPITKEPTKRPRRRFIRFKQCRTIKNSPPQ